MNISGQLEHKFCTFETQISGRDGSQIEGYASFFDICDQGGDIVKPGAYTASLETLGKQGRKVKMLWQHDPSQPIGVWDHVTEDRKGLFVKGRILTVVERGREAAALIAAGAIDGLSIGYKTRAAGKTAQGKRLLTDLDLWEVSLVTFPMALQARVSAKEYADCEGGNEDADWRDLAAAFQAAQECL